ncbi:cupin domain-containing protein [Limibacillus halophilus]|uniref:ChrR-like cupin domain-containing protein n=1 Tax=Limibacillus halophilus TaxID=1579333 RepID=A0A839STP2_9PROT|nr:cupin domain-containing protein [Limibacillus halophilus]MBB3066217.1 hypothetical protein [Limibacillus halophilus]
MELNADFTCRIALHAENIDWQESPTPGVSRRMLDRIGGEVARATTIVRYAAGSRFPTHCHEAGEEFLVLEGVFQDEHGDYPTGTYVRNPPTSSHAPASELGCTILVKLRQFAPDDRTFVRIDLNKIEALAIAGREGVSVTPLFRDSRETVRVERWDAGTAVPLTAAGGMEIFVLDGSFEQGGDTLQRHSWLRLPPGLPADQNATAVAGSQGATVWTKSGHLGDLI